MATRPLRCCALSSGTLRQFPHPGRSLDEKIHHTASVNSDEDLHKSCFMYHHNGFPVTREQKYDKKIK